MFQRRFHKKSRHGCLQCKKSRIKCDENRPKCGRCERIELDCSLADETSDLIIIPARPRETQTEQQNTELPDSKSPSASHSNGHSNGSPEDFLRLVSISTPDTEPSIVESNFTDIERERLRLMNHYCLSTSKTLAEITTPEDQDQSIWGTWVSELAFGNDFLLHGLLSLSALHLALCGVSRQKHTVMAIRHHDLGVALFRPHLSNIAADNYDAMFAFSCVVMFYSFGIERSSESKVNPIAKIHQMSNLIRSSAVIIKFDYEVLKRSCWSALMWPGPFKFTEKLPDEMEDMLSKLLQRTLKTISAANQKDVYSSAIQTLRDSLAIAITHKRAQVTVTYFPNMTPADFWTIVSAGEPLALAILANYAVILHWLRKNIWMEGWGKETVDAVRQALPTEWHECIAWAIRETECA